MPRLSPWGKLKLTGKSQVASLPPKDLLIATIEDFSRFSSPLSHF